MAISKSEMQGFPARIIAPDTKEIMGKVNGFDLSKNLSIKQFAENLQASIQTRRASSRMFIWGGERQLRKQELDIRQQQLFLQEINNLGLTAEEMATTQAKLFMIPEMIEAVISGERSKLQFARVQFMDGLKQIEDIARARSIENDRNQAEVDEMQSRMKREEILAEAEAERIRVDAKVAEMIGAAQAEAIIAKANIDLARARKEDAIVRLVNSIVDAGIDLDKASVMAASIINTILGSGGNIDIDSVIKEKMAEGMKTKLDEENEILKSKREREQAETTKRKHDIESEIRDDKGTTGGPLRS